MTFVRTILKALTTCFFTVVKYTCRIQIKILLFMTFVRTMGSGSFPGKKRPGRGVNHQPPSSAEVEEIIEIYIYSPPLGLHGLF